MFFTVLEARDSKIKVLANMMSDEHILLSLQPSYHILTTWRVCVSPSFYQDVNLIMKVPTSHPNLSLITSQRPHLLHHWGLGLGGLVLQHMSLGEMQTFTLQYSYFHLTIGTEDEGPRPELRTGGGGGQVN